MEFVLLLKMILVMTLTSGQIHVTNMVPPWPDPYWDIPGNYCSAAYPKLSCCPGPNRQDRCNVPILDTLCYCDIFCDRPENSDCCPDYFTHCKGLKKPFTPQTTEKSPVYAEGAPSNFSMKPDDCPFGALDISNPQCDYNGVIYKAGDVIRDNCNDCICQEPMSGDEHQSCMKVICSEEMCVTDQELLGVVTRSTKDWSPSNYSQFWGVSLHDVVRGRLGAAWPSPPESNMMPIHLSYNSSHLPLSFTWSQFQKSSVSVSDQGWCDNSAIVAALEASAARIQISSKGIIETNARSVLDCFPVKCHHQELENSFDDFIATPAKAWNYVKKHGLYDKLCDSSNDKCSGAGKCPVYKMMTGYRVGRFERRQENGNRRRMEDIMYEVKTQGPVLAIMEIYRDFFSYRNGVYHKINLDDKVIGHHAVRIIGWGQTSSGLKYWQVANTWGDTWGEEGLFRIRRGDNECRIEEMVTGSWPRGVRRHRRRRTRRRRGHQS